MKFNWIGYVSAAVVIALWGVTFASTRALMVDFSAFEIQIGRFFLAWIALWLMFPRHLRTEIPERWFMAMGLTGVFIYQLLENCAISYTNASNVAILVSFAPIMTAVLARILTKERALTLSFLLGSVLASSGVALVALSGVVNFSFHPIGDAMALLAMVSWGFYSILLDRVNKRGCPPILAIRKTFFWALVWMLPLVLWGASPVGGSILDGALVVRMDWGVNLARFARAGNLLHLGFLGFFASALCFALWNSVCSRLGVVRASIGLYFVPVVGVVFAAVVLGERLSLLSLFGGALILAGVALTHLKSRNLV